MRLSGQVTIVALSIVLGARENAMLFQADECRSMTPAERERAQAPIFDLSQYILIAGDADRERPAA
jgi:hypothetical protein